MPSRPNKTFECNKIRKYCSLRTSQFANEERWIRNAVENRGGASRRIISYDMCMYMYILELLNVLCMYNNNKIRIANLINGLVYPATFKALKRMMRLLPLQLMQGKRPACKANGQRILN